LKYQKQLKTSPDAMTQQCIFML